MKKILAIITILALSSFIQHVGTGNNFNFRNEVIKGKVKSINEISFAALVDTLGNTVNGVRTGFGYTTNYNKKGKLTECYEYLTGGELYTKMTFEYDETGRRIKGETYHSDGFQASNEIYKYDLKSKMTEYVRYLNNKESQSVKGTFEYDKKGNLIKENVYDIYGDILFNFTYIYSKKGDLIEHKEYENDAISPEVWKYKYDRKNAIVELHEYDRNGILRSKKNYTYKYDEKGNWIKKIEFVSDIPTTISERVIEYYE